MKRTILLTALLPLAVAACSTDKDYDLSDIDTSIVIAKGYTLPVGSFAPVYVEDVVPPTVALFYKDNVPVDTDTVYVGNLSFEGQTIVVSGLEDLSDDYAFSDATLNINVKSTIPCFLTMTATITDAQGNPIPTATVTVEGEVNEGSLDAPATSKLTVHMLSSDTDVTLSKLVLTPTGTFDGNSPFITYADSDTGHNNPLVIFNKRQYLQFTNVTLTLNSGILIKNL